jgi:hypothetical protein
VEINIKRTVAPANCFTALFGDAPGHPKVKLSKLPLKGAGHDPVKNQPHVASKTGGFAGQRRIR